MRGILFILLFLFSVNLFAQQKDEYFVNNNGDTVFCKIIKNDIDKFKIAKSINHQNVFTADSVKMYSYQNTKWTRESCFFGEEIGTRVHTFYVEPIFQTVEKKIFLPIVTNSGKFKLGSWGAVLGPKNYGRVEAFTDGKTCMYNVHTSKLRAQVTSYFDQIFIKKDNHELIQIPFAKDRKDTSTNDHVIKYLKALTADKQEITKDLDNNFFANYDNVCKYLERYISKK